MRCLSCSFGFLLSHYHVIHIVWRVSLALHMQAWCFGHTKAQIIIFWAKRRTISVLSGIFPQWDWIICTQTNWNKSKRNEGQRVSGIKRNISVDMFFFRPSSKKNEFHFFFDYRNMRAFNFETFFSTFNGCVCSPNDINRVAFFSSKSEFSLVSNLATCVNCLVLHECKPT